MQTNLAKRGVRGIIVGHLNCKRYPDFCVEEKGRIESSIDSMWRAIRWCSFDSCQGEAVTAVTA